MTTRPPPENPGRPHALLVPGPLVVLAAGSWLVAPPSLATRMLTGLTIALVATGYVLFALRRELFSLPWTEDDSPEPGSLGERARHDALWFVHLRWLATAVALGLVSCASLEARGLLLVWWAVLLVANLLWSASTGHWRRPELWILAQAVADLAILTGFLNASGGLENPLYTVFLFHVIVGRILLPGRLAVWVTLAAAGFFGLLAFGEYLHLLPHFPNSFFPHVEPADPSLGSHGHGHDGSAHASYDLYFVLGRTFPFLIVLLLGDFFLAKVMRRLRGSEGRLVDAARAARVERDRLESVVNTAGVGMMQLDRNGTVQWFSERISAWFGWRFTTEGSLCPLLKEEDGCSVCVALAVSSTGEPQSSERRWRTPSGERYFRHSAAPLSNAAGEVVQVVEVVEDVTPQRHLELRAIREGKLSVLGRMAAGIAHEIGNPLSSLSTRLRLLRRRRNEDFVDQSIVVLETQIARIRRIVQGVSQFARNQPLQRSTWSLDDLVTETIDVLRYDRRSRGIEIRAELDARGLRVHGSRDQIGQILMNLLLNALEVTPEGGVVTVRTREDGAQLRIAVEDQGPGISEEARDHLFEPFFTTRTEGTGLGLSISYGLAAAHEGSIEAECLEGAGARFTLLLPSSEHQLDSQEFRP